MTKGEPPVALRMETDADARLVEEYHSVSVLSDCIPGRGRAQSIGMCGKMTCCHRQSPKANAESGGADESVPLRTVSLETQRRSAPSSEECGQVSSTSKYKLRNRTDEQAKLYPDLQKEIAQRRAQARGPVKDQYSEAYRDEICKLVKDKGLVPEEYRREFEERVLRPYSDRFWVEGCAPPKITDFQAHIELKPNIKQNDSHTP